MKHRFHTVTLALGALLLALLVPAGTAAAAEREQQQRPQAQFGEEMTVSEVLLDVLVTSKDGDVIVGLGPEDFTVREGDETIPVDTATFYSSSVPEKSVQGQTGASRVDPVPEDRYFILFFDDQRKNQSVDGGNRLLQRQMQAGRDAQRWVEDSLAPADWVAVVSYDRSLRVFTDFTRDRQRLANAIEEATSGGPGLGTWPSRQSTQGPALTDDLPQGRDLVKKTPRIYSALEEVAKAAADVKGRKNLIYVGLGFGRLNSFGQYEPDNRYYQPMLHALNDANVAVYTVDVTPPTVSHTFENALTELSEETGGRYYPFATSFATPLSEISKETSGYYLLSYRTQHPVGKEGYQKVEVETKNPSFKVRVRQGYEY
jgi:VWFA-related protein